MPNGTSLSSTELMHYGVRGMKWGVRRAEKRRSKYANQAKRKAEMHESLARTYSKDAKELKSMSDSAYAKRFDDKDYLKSLGGAKKARTMEIKECERMYKSSIESAKKWTKVHDDIMSAPIGSLKTRKDYKQAEWRSFNNIQRTDSGYRDPGETDRMQENMRKRGARY